MHRFAAALTLLVLAVSYPVCTEPSGTWLDPYRANAEKLMAAAQADQFAWDRLAELTDTFGQR